MARETRPTLLVAGTEARPTGLFMVYGRAAGTAHHWIEPEAGEDACPADCAAEGGGAIFSWFTGEPQAHVQLPGKVRAGISRARPAVPLRVGPGYLTRFRSHTPHNCCNAGRSPRNLSRSQ